MENDALELLRKMLEIPSVNSSDDERNMAEFICEYFRKNGLSAEVHPIDGTHANVTAFIPGKNVRKTVIWNGHLDTVPYGNLEEWDTNPAYVSEKDGRIYARGASDMKSGLAAMIYALCHTPDKPACNIQFLGTCDEEKNGLGASEIVKEHLLAESDSMLIAEPTGMRLGVAQKGCLWLQIKVKGKTSHGAYPKEGVNAIHHGMHLAEKIKSYVETFSFGILGGSTAQITKISGGVAPNMTADECGICMDIRMVPGLTKEMILNHAEALLLQEQEETSELRAEFEILNTRRAIMIEGQHPMVSALRKIVRSHGYEGTDIGINFFTDASLLDSKDERKILLFGPGEPFMAHKPNEYVKIKKYTDAVRVLLELMQEYGI